MKILNIISIIGISIIVGVIIFGVSYAIIFQYNNGYSPRGLEINKFCVEKGYDKLIETMSSYTCQKIKGDIIYQRKVIIDINTNKYYFLSEETLGEKEQWIEKKPNKY